VGFTESITTSFSIAPMTKTLNHLHKGNFEKGEIKW